MQKLARSNDSEFLESVLKEAAKSKYTVMGSSAGDGGVYYADSPEEAFAHFVAADSGRHDIDKIMKEMKEEDKKSGHKFEEKSSGHWEYGDYEIKLVK